MFVLGKKHRIALFLRDGNRDNFLAHTARADGVCGALLAAQREEVLIPARDVKLLSDDFTGFRHRIGSVLGFHQRVDEAPANGGVLELRGTGEGAVRFAHYKWSAGHAFDTASNDKVGLTGFDGA